MSPRREHGLAPSHAPMAEERAAGVTAGTDGTGVRCCAETKFKKKNRRRQK